MRPRNDARHGRLLMKTGMKIERVWAMPNARTFTIKPIARLLREEFDGPYVDPFPYPYERDALLFLQDIPTGSAQYLAFGPPYSQRQLKELYDGNGISLGAQLNTYWRRCRVEITRIMKPGGKVISFGWNSVGIGKRRGFAITRILLVSHGRDHNDTICTVERKIQASLV